MSKIRTMIDSGSLWPLTICIFSLCLAIPAPGTAASPADLAAQADDLLPASSKTIVDQPEIIIPKPPPSAQGSLLPASSKTIVDQPEIIIPKPPPAARGTMEQTA